jgi:uncharacterized membrane protein YoaK (UPF0700 family)
VTRQALLGLAVVIFGIGGLAAGIARVAPGSSAVDIVLAAVACVVGGALFWFTLRVGRRGAHPQTKWLLVPILIGALYIDRLPERWQLVLLLFATGYIVAFVGTIVARVVRMSRSSS